MQANGMNYDDTSQLNLQDHSEYAPTITTYNVVNEGEKDEMRQDMEPGGNAEDELIL